VPAWRPSLEHFSRLVAPVVSHGGGGGGERSPTPPSRGDLPKFVARQFTAPSATPPAITPILAIEPALIGPPEIKLPDLAIGRLGDPFGRNGQLSSGPGSGGGIGGGSHGGVGDNDGPGFGDKDGGGMSARAATGSISAPELLYKTEPEFSEEARKAKYQGTVVLNIEVGEDGKPRRMRIVQGLGLGLDDKALEAVSRWLFRPAMRNGRPTTAPATIEVNFRLL